MSTGQTAIELVGVGKRFTKYDDVPTLVGRAMQWRSRTQRGQLWAVRNLDLAVARGEALGILGQNGSGKSTLLSMMAGVTAPTEGFVRVRGRVAPLIAVGVGFHPELTGRENIYVNGTILGLSTAEIDRRFDQIVDFAEIPEFIDTPVKFYSSGMFVRLGFAVAVAADPDLLLVDEVLAVGDLAFQMKCYERLRELQDQGTTLVTVSHNLAAVRNLCSRVLVMDHGTAVFDGDTGPGISTFHSVLSKQRAHNDDDDPEVQIPSVRLLSPDGAAISQFAAGDAVVIEFDVVARRPLNDVALGVTVSNQAGILVYAENTPPPESLAVPEGGMTGRVRLDLRVAGGSYSVQVIVGWNRSGDKRRAVTSAPTAFYVTGRPMVNGVADLQASFTASSRDGRSSESARDGRAVPESTTE